MVAEWVKKEISKSEVSELTKRFGVNPLAASIFVRRGVNTGRDLLYYLEDDLRFQHNPFLFNTMEDAVDRILQAMEEKEKVLIFGDRDVDGVTATTVLYECLERCGIDVRYRLPLGDDGYGLSMNAVDDFAKEYGSLIITVDCGISNVQEIAHAAELGMDVIVLDHHNPPDELPSPAIIVDAKIPDSGYPFPDISGCAVAYKTVSALRFSRSKWYKMELCLLNAREEEEGTVVECIKIRNLVPMSRLVETVVPGEKGIMDTRLPSYLQGQMILVWDEKNVSSILERTFGNSAQFNCLDIRPDVAQIIPQVANLPLSAIKKFSKLARYGDHEPTEIGGFYNIFVSYVNQSQRRDHPEIIALEEKELQLVALAALADIMPMKNENRIFVSKALESINAGKIRPGLLDLMADVNLLGKRVNSTDLSWILVSNLNAAGRMGQPAIAAELFLSRDQGKSQELAQKIIDLNSQRKQLSSDAMDYGIIQAKNSISNHSGKLCVVIDERINRGVTGILAGRLESANNVPAIVVTFVEDTAVGSMRSCRGFSATAFLDKIADLFINHGGHDAAAGFSFERSRLPEFESRLKELAQGIQLENSKDGIYDVDAEIPLQYLTPDLLAIEDLFEPFGEKNEQLLFMSRNVPVVDAMIMGKGEKQHLKVIID
ncbi:MAG: single-stranded-DNA-specific exonuclease RecJ, partial [Treponema sp.]|nr:single-stranded-DNA-specific exonuclease RecJ [Treponema sp.]